MRVLVDTSVWSLVLLRREPPVSRSVERLRAFSDRGDVVTLGVIVQEVLAGFRTDAAARKAAVLLRDFPMLPLSRDDFVAAAALKRACARAGVAAGTGDCQIAAAAIAHRCRLLTVDQDFTRIADVSSLRLA